MSPCPWIPRLAWVLLGLLTATSAPGAAGDGRLRLYWIDSEGGGSTLLVTPAGESVLIDSGNPGVRDAGRIHQVATTRAGLKQIDHLIVTHFHIDHFGGAPELAALIPIRQVWDNGVPETDPDGRRESTWPLTSRGYRDLPVEARHRVEPGTLIPLRSAGTPVFLRCVMTRQQAWKPAPTGPATWAVRRASGEPVPPRERDGSDNANSSAWVLGLGGFRFFDAGDLTWNVEASLVVPEVLVPEVDVYQVTHHGLDVSNHPGLLRALNPRVAVMNNGPTKGAAGQVMQTLRGLAGLQQIYQLHRNLRPDGATHNVDAGFIANAGPTDGCAGHPIELVVEPDGRAYSVLIPSQGHEKRYATRHAAE